MSKPDFREATNATAKECERLPEGWEIVLQFSADEASLSLFDPNGDEVEVHSGDSCHIQEAIDTAHEEAKAFSPEPDRCQKCRGAGTVPTWTGSLFRGSLEVCGEACPNCGGSGREQKGGTS